MKILIVDDDSHTRILLRELLEAEEFEVLAAQDGPAGLAITRSYGEEVDRILVDYHMPGMDGLSFIKALRRLGYLERTVVYLMSSEGQARYYAKTIGADFIPKPFDLSHLVEVLRSPPRAR